MSGSCKEIEGQLFWMPCSSACNSTCASIHACKATTRSTNNQRPTSAPSMFHEARTAETNSGLFSAKMSIDGSVGSGTGCIRGKAAGASLEAGSGAASASASPKSPQSSSSSSADKEPLSGTGSFDSRTFRLASPAGLLSSAEPRDWARSGASSNAPNPSSSDIAPGVTSLNEKQHEACKPSRDLNEVCPTH